MAFFKNMSIRMSIPLAILAFIILYVIVVVIIHSTSPDSEYDLVPKMMTFVGITKSDKNAIPGTVKDVRLGPEIPGGLVA